MKTKIVPMHSAILLSYTAIGIHANHSDMTKFRNPKDSGYESAMNELWRWSKDLSATTLLSGKAISYGEGGNSRMPRRKGEQTVVQGGSRFRRQEMPQAP
jgi:hypothetical protein